MAAFLEKRTWIQADLARSVGLTRPEALRTVLQELVDEGIPLESERSPPHVYWRVAKDWYPGGVLFKAEHVPALLRQLSHLPSGDVRDRLLGIVLGQLPARGKLTPAAPVVSRKTSEQEEEYTPIVEESAARRLPLFMRYLTASRGGRSSDRHVSVHVIDIGPPARFVATCHKNGDLRWFRVDGIARARVDDSQKFRECDPAVLAAYRAASLDGFKGAGPAIACSFLVREPECVWVANNLLEGMHSESVQGGMRVTVETSAILALARFVVRFGDAVQPETPALARAVAELARGALDQADALLRRAEKETESADLGGAPARPRSDV